MRGKFVHTIYEHYRSINCALTYIITAKPEVRNSFVFDRVISLSYTGIIKSGSGGMEDTQRSGRCGLMPMRVQLPPSAFIYLFYIPRQKAGRYFYLGRHRLIQTY